MSSEFGPAQTALDTSVSQPLVEPSLLSQTIPLGITKTLHVSVAAFTQLFKAKGFLREDEDALAAAIFRPFPILHQLLQPFCTYPDRLTVFLALIAETLVGNLQSRTPPKDQEVVPSVKTLSVMLWSLVAADHFPLMTLQETERTALHLETIVNISKLLADRTKVDIKYELGYMFRCVTDRRPWQAAFPTPLLKKKPPKPKRKSNELLRLCFPRNIRQPVSGPGPLSLESKLSEQADIAPISDV